MEERKREEEEREKRAVEVPVGRRRRRAEAPKKALDENALGLFAGICHSGTRICGQCDRRLPSISSRFAARPWFIVFVV